MWWRDRLRKASPRPDDQHRHRRPRPSCALPAAGGLWSVGREDAAATLPDLRGPAPPRTRSSPLRTRPIPALTLVGSGEGRPPLQQSGLEVLDEAAAPAYRARLADIDRELDDAAERADLGRRPALQDERQALLEQLDQATGLGGRRRVTGSSDERARIAVRKALSAAMAGSPRSILARPSPARAGEDRYRRSYEPDLDQPVPLGAASAALSSRRRRRTVRS